MQSPIDRYVIVKEISSGSYSKVYLAKDTVHNNKLVAMKVMNITKLSEGKEHQHPLRVRLSLFFDISMYYLSLFCRHIKRNSNYATIET